MTNLQQLALLPVHEGYNDGDAPWEQLRALTALRLAGVSSSAPTCLSRLTQLRSLHLARRSGTDHLSVAEAEVLEAALPALQQLTHLGLELVLPGPPSSLTALRQLRSFGFLRYEELHIDCPGIGGALPAGPWLASLRRVAGGPNFLFASLPALVAATQLQELALVQLIDSEQPAAISMLQWAAGRPARKRVRVRFLSFARNPRLAAAEVARQNPQLSLDVLEPRRHEFDEQDLQLVLPDLPPVPSYLTD